jgi:hypothetical protein
MAQDWSDERVGDIMTARMERESISGKIDPASSFIIWDITENDKEFFNNVKNRVLDTPSDNDINTVFVDALYEMAWEKVTTEPLYDQS